MIPAGTERDEWLLDESIKETFPASDSTSPIHPGSLLGTRYASRSRSDAFGGWATWLIGALVGSLLAGIILATRRNGRAAYTARRSGT
jgi:hypothetical protein